MYTFIDTQLIFIRFLYSFLSKSPFMLFVIHAENIWELCFEVNFFHDVPLNLIFNIDIVLYRLVNLILDYVDEWVIISEA